MLTRKVGPARWSSWSPGDINLMRKSARSHSDVTLIKTVNLTEAEGRVVAARGCGWGMESTNF